MSAGSTTAVAAAGVAKSGRKIFLPLPILLVMLLFDVT